MRSLLETYARYSGIGDEQQKETDFKCFKKWFFKLILDLIEKLRKFGGS